jgi:spermidine/putrescine-binding protein
MKKIFMSIIMAVVVFTLSACGGNQETLYVLNWGEYMDSDLVTQFEKENDVKVVYDIVDSNEAMEIRLKSNSTPYDIAIPSDYMIDKLRQQDLLNEINQELLPALESVSIIERVNNLTKDKGYHDYFVPYFWGTLGIMYNTDTVIEEDLTGFGILFDNSEKYDIGMYDSSRDASAAALLALGKDVNTSNEADLKAAEDLMKLGKYKLFGTDDLKEKVQKENIDLALVYSGDYFDLLYAAEEEEATINFGYYVPDKTNVWVDGMVIPTTSENTELAHKFINFFLQVDVTTQNSDWVGYAPVTQEAYVIMVGDDYGYDYDNYDPFPLNSERAVYEFVSNERFARLDEMLKAAKAANNE